MCVAIAYSAKSRPSMATAPRNGSCRRERRSNSVFFLLFRRFLPPNQDHAVHSKVLVRVRGTCFPSLLGEESGSLTYVERVRDLTGRSSSGALPPEKKNNTNTRKYKIAEKRG